MNTPSASQTNVAPASAADQMKAVKASLDRAPAGSRKDEAQKHYAVAEKAMAAKNDAECIRECEATTKSLS